MKKFFTLICMTFAAMSIYAQDVYKSIEIVTNADGSESYVLAAEFKAVVGEDGQTATNVVDGKSVIKFSTENVDVEAVGGSTPKKRDAGGEEINPDGTVIAWSPITWRNANNRIVKDEEGNITYRILNVAGTGNPYVGIGVEEIVTDGSPTGNYRATYEYYLPDGSKGMPLTGLYYKFTPKVSGKFKVMVWANKTNRNVYVVDESTKQAISYTADGFMNNNTYATEEEIQKIHNDRFVNAETGEDSNPYVIGNGNPFFGWVNFEAEAGKSYWLFMDSSQIGFGGFEFTAGGDSGVANIKADADKDAPSYNLAGQRVDENYKGVVIKNGKKVVKK